LVVTGCNPVTTESMVCLVTVFACVQVRSLDAITVRQVIESPQQVSFFMTNKPVLFITIISSVIVASVFLYIPAIQQDRRYHDFADQRQFFEIPNFINVVTNLPFFVIGLMGIRLIAHNNFPGGLPEMRRAYQLFFIGILLTGLGSAYYHLCPSNETLVWDRLPMTIAFMAFFSIIIGENIAIETGIRLLYALVIVGMSSVVYWYWGELHQQGDLRFYALVQFMPMLLAPVILISGQCRFVSNACLWQVLAAYAVAKLAEYGDHALYLQSDLISGHSFKHLIAAAGVWMFFLGLKNRLRLM
jgi:hypothetical protein